MKRPFEGLLVLEATHVLAGPYCGYQLSLLGAETIKVEPPHTPDPVRGRGPVPGLNAARMGFNYLAQGSNKKSLTLDLKKQEGRDIFLKLAARADVVIENYRTGALEKLGLGYEDIRKINTDIIYCSITAYGHKGPWARRTGYDPAIQAISGITTRTGKKFGEPVRPAAPFVDYGAGISAAFAVASALFHRERTGEGQKIDCAMLDVAFIMTGHHLVADAYGGPKQMTPQEAGTSCYRTKDGYFQLGAYNVRENARLWKALGRPEFAEFKTWEELWDNADRMHTVLSEIMLTKTADEWERFLSAADVPGGRVRTPEEAVGLDHVAERGFLSELPAIAGVEGVRVPTAAFSFRDGGPHISSPPPRFGEHTDEILSALDFDAEQIAQLREDGVI